jgi:2-amino-4-hydroxy-6-hydroxymethyldihydropteridine diphosphokinase
VYVGLGSNLQNPREQVRRALQELARLPGTRLDRHSSLYRSTPLGPQDQPDYVNAVACLATELEPLSLLDALQAIEQAHGRVRDRHWGARTLDLDILLYGDRVIALPRLQVPHPQMHLRSFVLKPLLEIAPGLAVPGRGPVAELAQAVDDLQTSALGD